MKKVDYSNISLDMIKQSRIQAQPKSINKQYQTRNASFQRTSEILADARGTIDTNFKQ